MLLSYITWPEQVRSAIETWGLYGAPGSYQNIVVFGMGGSGIVGDYVQLLSTLKGKYPIVTVKSHIVPSFVNQHTLSLVISYSGNTLETIVAFKKLVERKATVITISSGGLLKEYSAKYRAVHIEVPSGLLPRASLPYMLFSSLGALDVSGYGIISKDEAERCSKFLSQNLSVAGREGRNIAEWLHEKVVREGRLAVLATHSPLEPLALRFKNELNENSKIIAKVDVAPEWMHNDIVGYEASTLKNIAVLELVDPDDPIGLKLVDFMGGIYADYEAPRYRFETKGTSILEKLVYGSLVAGIASVLLAEMRGIDPAETRSIAKYKALAQKIFV